MTSASGLLLVDKSTGLTSHDVVARLRRVLGERRIGHAGTLDPLATGLLVVGVGSATRLLRFAQGEQKRYVGTVVLGVATDSLDADGVVTGHGPVPAIGEGEMNEAAQRFVGVIEQVPPMVSALKVNGRRLYELQREGVHVERAPRRIEIAAFTLTPSDDPSSWHFDVTCSVGTYVRVLLSDLCAAVGTVGHLGALRRVRSGSHVVDAALGLEAIEARVAAGEDVVQPPSAFVGALSQVTLDEQNLVRLGHGQRLDLGEWPGDEIAVFDQAGSLVGILRRRGDLWQPELVFTNAGQS